MIDDASRVWSLDDLHLPGDGVSYDGPGTQLLAIRARAGGGNSIAHCDNRTYRQPLADGDAAPVDGTANRYGDAATGADTAPNAHADTGMPEHQDIRPLSPMDGNALEDAETDVDAIADVGAMRHAGPLGSLPAVLLAAIPVGRTASHAEPLNDGVAVGALPDRALRGDCGAQQGGR